jgi:hypothetical protein
VPWRDAQLIGDLTKREAQPAESLRRGEPVQATVPFRMSVELIDESELAIPPCSGFRKDAFDKGPRSLELRFRELLGEWPASSWSRIGRQALGVNVVRTMSSSDRRQPPSPNVQAKRLDVASKPARRSVQFHQLRRRHVVIVAASR